MGKLFSEWLLDRLRENGYSQSDFSRRSGLSKQAISNYLNQQRANPDNEAIKKIAAGLGLPEEMVFRAAGVLPERRPVKSFFLEFMEQMGEQLSAEEQEDIMDNVKSKLARKSRSKETVK